MTSNFERVREILLRRLKHARKMRFSVERNWPGTTESESALRRIIEGELDLLFGLAMFAYVDERFDYEDAIFEALDGGVAITEWHKFPANAIYYFGNDRIMWTIALLLYASTHRQSGQERDEKLRERLRQSVNEFIALCDEGFPPAPASEVQQRLRVRNNLNVLLAELTPRRKEKHELIRFLHSHLLAPPQRHSPINSALTDVGVALEQLLASTSPISTNRGHASSGSAFMEIDFEGKKGQSLKVLLDEAVYTTGLLQDIAGSASELFFVTPTTRSELSRYTTAAEEPGFAHDIVRMGDLLQRIRMDARLSKMELQEIVDLRRIIFEDLWDKFSRLRKEIARYVVPVLAAIEDAINWANENLGRIGFANVWTLDARNLNAGQTASDDALLTDDPKWNVLVDPQLVKQVLRNILYNARHNFRGYELPADKSWGDLATLSIDIESRVAAPDGESLNHVVIRTKSLGVPPSPAALERAAENSTFAQHWLQVKEFGGSLSLRPTENEGGAAVELALLSRAGVQIGEPRKKRVPA